MRIKEDDMNEVNAPAKCPSVSPIIHDTTDAMRCKENRCSGLLQKYSKSAFSINHGPQDSIHEIQNSSFRLGLTGMYEEHALYLSAGNHELEEGAPSKPISRTAEPVWTVSVGWVVHVEISSGVTLQHADWQLCSKKSWAVECGISTWALSPCVNQAEAEVKRLKAGEFPRGQSSCDKPWIGLCYMTACFPFPMRLVHAYVITAVNYKKVIFIKGSLKGGLFFKGAVWCV